MKPTEKEINFILWVQFLTGRTTFAQAGEYKGIKFHIRTKENGHKHPHIHVEYQGKWVSISLITFEVLSGKLHPQQRKSAIKWCKDNSSELKRNWAKYHGKIVA